MRALAALLLLGLLPPAQEPTVESILEKLEARVAPIERLTVEIVSGRASRGLVDDGTELCFRGRIVRVRGGHYLKQVRIWAPTSKELTLLFLENSHEAGRDAYRATIGYRSGEALFIAFQDDRKNPELFRTGRAANLALIFSTLVQVADVALWPRCLGAMGAELTARRVREDGREYATLSFPRTLHIFGERRYLLTWFFDARTHRFEKLLIVQDEDDPQKITHVIRCEEYARIEGVDIPVRFSLVGAASPFREPATAELVLGNPQVRPPEEALARPGWMNDPCLPVLKSTSAEEARKAVAGKPGDLPALVGLLSVLGLDDGSRDVQAEDVGPFRALLAAESDLARTAAYCAFLRVSPDTSAEVARKATESREILALEALRQLDGGRPAEALDLVARGSLEKLHQEFAEDVRALAGLERPLAPERILPLLALPAEPGAALRRMNRLAKRGHTFLSRWPEESLPALASASEGVLQVAAARSFMDREKRLEAGAVYVRLCRNRGLAALLEEEIAEAAEEALDRHRFFVPDPACPLADWIEQAAASYPKNETLLRNAADIDLLRGHDERAIARLEKLLPTRGKDSEPWAAEYRFPFPALGTLMGLAETPAPERVRADSPPLHKLALACIRRNEIDRAAKQAEAQAAGATTRVDLGIAAQAYLILGMPDRALALHKRILLTQLLRDDPLQALNAAGHLSLALLSRRRLEEAYHASGVLQRIPATDADNMEKAKKIRADVLRAFSEDDLIRVFCAEAPPLPEASAPRVGELIGKLDADEVAVREEAEQKLREIGPSVASALEKARRGAAGERALRIRAVLSDLAHRHRGELWEKR